MNAQQALHPPRCRGRDDIVIRAARPNDCEGIAALGNMPGYRWGTLRLPYQTPEATRKWLESMAPGNISLVVGARRPDHRQWRLRAPPGPPLPRRPISAWACTTISTAGASAPGCCASSSTIADDWLNLRRIELTVYVDNAPAIALYERNGFEIEGTHRDFAFRGGAFVDAYAMARLKAELCDRMRLAVSRSIAP